MIYFIIAALVLVAPVTGSLAVCAPKWARAKGITDKLEDATDRVNSWLPDTRNWNTFWTKKRAWLAPVRWLWATPVFIICGLAVALYGWFLLWFKVIEQKCPYSTYSHTMQDEWQEFDSFTKVNGIFHGLYT